MISRGTVLGLLLVSGVAASQEPGYLRTHVPNTEICLDWPDRIYTFHYHSAGSQQTPGDSEFTAMDAAFDTWRAQSKSCSDFQFVKGQMVGVANVGYNPKSSDNLNVLVFRERSCRDVVPSNDQCLVIGTCANTYQCWDHGDSTIALTTNTFSNQTGVIFDADVEFNAAPKAGGGRFLFTTVSSPPCDAAHQSSACVATDVQNTLTHEIGHVIGLDHVQVSGSTMEPSAPLGELSKRIIDPGTQAGFCQIYPAHRSTPRCDGAGAADQGTVAVNQGTPGLESVGCNSTGVLPFGFAALALGGLLTRRRRQPA